MTFGDSSVSWMTQMTQALLGKRSQFSAWVVYGKNRCQSLFWILLDLMLSLLSLFSEKLALKGLIAKVWWNCWLQRQSETIQKELARRLILNNLNWAPSLTEEINLSGQWSILRMGRYTLWGTVIFSLLLLISGYWAVISCFSFLKATSLFSCNKEGWKVSLWPVSTLHHFCHYWELNWHLANLMILFLLSCPQCYPEFF